MFSVLTAMKTSEPYQNALSQLQQHPQIMMILGEPISGGLPKGSINVNGNQGEADLAFAVEGPNGKGRVYIEARKQLGRWQTEHAEFESAATGERIPFGE